MKVAGITNQQEIFVVSEKRNFRLNELLIIEDPNQGDLLGEVVVAHTFNPFLPLQIGGEIADDEMIDALKKIGYEIETETVYIAKVRVLKEAKYPIQTGASLREPTFDEVKPFFVHTTPEEGLLIGVIKNTDNVAKNMDDSFKNLLEVVENGEVHPQRDIPYLYAIRNMHQYPHVGIFGGSGSGKSYGMRVLLEELMRQGVPTLMVDPHYEMEFTQTVGNPPFDYTNRAEIFQVGQDVGVNFIDIETRELKNLIGTISELSESMQNIIEIVHRKQDSVESFKGRLMALLEVLEIGSEEKIREQYHSAEPGLEKEAWAERIQLYKRFSSLPQTSVQGVLWRFNSLHRSGIFNHTTKPLEDALQEGKLIVMQGNAALLQVFTTFVCDKFYKMRRAYKDGEKTGVKEKPFVPFIICTDEAHQFAPQHVPTPSKAIFKEIAQEGRKYGVFLVFATQRPSLLDHTITAQLNTKFIFRTVRASDMQTLQEETDLSREDVKRLPYLQSGDVFISESSTGRTVFGRIRRNHTESPHSANPFDELRQMKRQSVQKYEELILSYVPFNDSFADQICKQLEAKGQGTYSVRTLITMADKLVEQGVLTKKANMLGMTEYKKADE